MAKIRILVAQGNLADTMKIEMLLRELDYQVVGIHGTFIDGRALNFNGRRSGIIRSVR